MTISSESPPIRASRVATCLATFTGNLYLVLATVVISLLALLTSWVPPRERTVFRWSRLWSRGLLASSGVRLCAESRAALDRTASYVFMANHQSLFDIPALLASVPVVCRFMAKRSLFQLPLFGWALAAGGYISVDRRSEGGARAGFTRAVEELRSGASLVVFPEGTRSLDGRLLPFKRGGLLLALRCGLPIVPVGIRGTLDVRNRRSYLIRPGRVEVHYGEPIETAGRRLADLGRLETELRRRISELAGLEAAPG